MKQEKRKVGLGLVIFALGLITTAIAQVTGSQVDKQSFSANVDSAIEDIEQVLDAGVTEPEPTEVAEKSAVTVKVTVVEPESESEKESASIAEPASIKEMGVAAQAEIVEALTVSPEEEQVVREAEADFSGFHSLPEVAKTTQEMVPEASEEVDVIQVPEIVESDTIVVAPSAVLTPNNKISVQLDKAGLEEAINLFSQLSSVNIIIPKLERDGTVTVNLHDVEWKPALQSVLDAYNLDLYQKVPSVEIYTIREKPADAPEPLELKTFKLDYATVTEVEALVTSILPAGGIVAKFPSRNMISVRSTAASLEEINQLISQVDMPRQQVFIEAKFLELSDGAQEDLGIDWEVLQGYGVGMESLSLDTTRSWSDSRSSTVYKDMNGQQYDAVDTSFEEFAARPGADPSNIRMADITPTETLSSGSSSEKTFAAVLSADAFNIVLSALQESEGANMVSNPKIIVANEETATIGIVRQEPNIRQRLEQSSGDKPDIEVYELDENQPYFEYGIKLNVTPTVNTLDNITVQIKPELTRFVSDKVAGDNTYPIIDSKSVDTIFSLQSGQTAAIGGLTETQDSETERKIPLLGDIPLLGRLFKYNQTITEQQETIIFVTLGLANPSNIRLDQGLPEDTELARRHFLKNRHHAAVRELEREIYDLQQQKEQELIYQELMQTRQMLKDSGDDVESPAVTAPIKSEETEQADILPVESTEGIVESTEAEEK